ncbi:MAG: hypothetical protein FLDDKLPJ_02185 [Phycisphaerae bacterium]|nr:hypothetical protein [Phycisphaerae bacterium]
MKAIRSFQAAVLAAAVAGFAAGATRGQDAGGAPGRSAAPPPEELRFDSGEFIEGLRRRGLVDLLELYLKEHPPRSADARAALDQEILRARFADRSLPPEERLAALRQANALLENLIRDKSKDPQALEWHADLAFSRLFDEGESVTTAIVYREGGPAERAALREITDDAIQLLDDLRTSLEAEFSRLQGLSEAEYEQVERSGHVERLESRVRPKAEYARLWALYYNALSRTADDPERKTRLSAVQSMLEDHPEWTEKNAALEAQSLLISGMALRLAGEAGAAEAKLSQVQPVAEKRPPQVRSGLAWAEFLASLERVRALRDGGRYDDALIALDQMRLTKTVAGTPSGSAAVSIALCERSVHLARADAERGAGRQEQADRHRASASACVLRRIREDATLREPLYAALYAQLGEPESASGLDALERAAMVAVMLGEAERTRQAAESSQGEAARADLLRRAGALFDRAMQAAEFAEGTDAAAAPTDADLTAEIAFNGAVAAYRSGKAGKAALGLLRVARDFPSFSEASRAAVLAVQVSSDLYREAAGDERAAARDLHLEALKVLTSTHASDPAARYWRFFYAQALEEAGRRREAADQYLLVDAGHPHALDAEFLRWRCVAEDLIGTGTSASSDDSHQRRIQEIVEGLAAFRKRAERVNETGGDAEQGARLREHVAEATLLPLELALSGGGAAPSPDAFAAVETLSASTPRLRFRVLRARLIALAEADQLEALQAGLASLVESDEGEVAPVLQAIYARLMSGWSPVDAPVAEGAMQRRAKAAAFVADRLLEVSTRPEAAASKDRASCLILRGEAQLAAGDLTGAATTFEEAGGATALDPRKGGDARPRLGLAECRFASGNYAEALPLFNELARLEYDKGGEEAHWRALVRDLQCRLALQHDPRGVLKVIENHRVSSPDLGGPKFSAAFEQLRRACLQRLNPEPASSSP